MGLRRGDLRSTLVLCAMWLLCGSSASAQGVLFSLPADGTWVRYEGTYAQTEIRSNQAAGKLAIRPWVERVWIKSVGVETAEWKGEAQACRWIEIKVERGREVEGAIDTGLTGLTLYKVLVPEAAVTGKLIDDAGVPVNHLPIVKGYRKIGAGEPLPLTTLALQVYPLIVPVGYYRTTNELPNAPLVTGLGSIQTQAIRGKTTLERPAGRTLQETTVWRSDEVPFGLAGWKSKVTREAKDDRQETTSFSPIAEVMIELKAQATGNDAESELMVP